MQITTDQEYSNAVLRVEELINDDQPEMDTELEDLCTAIESYESIHYPIDSA